ncbi:uncharacterized protein RHOBADRAFT_15257, partial [Rhodotorula graminis WP1]
INFFKVLGSLTALQWAFFLSGWLAWTCDAIDFFAVSLSNHRLEIFFDKPLKQITTSITLTLLFRPAGAVIFGLASDRWGRKYPLIIDLCCCGALSLGTAFVKTFPQFLAVRCLFGIAMGGIWGLSAALALENMPVRARGLFSGLLQQGYAVGYLIAAVLNLTEVARHNDFKILFYFASAVSFFAALVRLVLPESAYFLERREADKAQGTTVSSSTKSKIFLREAGRALKIHWVRCIFAVIIMSLFNFFSHSSQDVYPSYIQDGKGLSAHTATLATIVGNVGAIVGGTVAGYVSQFLGRRLTIIVMCIWTCAFIPLWYLPSSFAGLAAGAFFVQFGVQGAWGVIPVYLAELSPVAFRAVWPGVAYQLGNMVSSASAQIEATAGENLKTAAGRPNYGLIGVILIVVRPYPSSLLLRLALPPSLLNFLAPPADCRRLDHRLLPRRRRGARLALRKGQGGVRGGRRARRDRGACVSFPISHPRALAPPSLSLSPTRISDASCILLAVKDDTSPSARYGEADLEKDGQAKIGQPMHRESASMTDDKRSVSTYA